MKIPALKGTGRGCRIPCFPSLLPLGLLWVLCSGDTLNSRYSKWIMDQQHWHSLGTCQKCRTCWIPSQPCWIRICSLTRSWVICMYIKVCETLLHIKLMSNSRGRVSLFGGRDWAQQIILCSSQSSRWRDRPRNQTGGGQNAFFFFLTEKSCIGGCDLGGVKYVY